MIDRRNVSASVEDDFNSCDDSVIDSYVVAAAMHHLKMSTLTDKPNHSSLKDNLWTKDKETRSDILMEVCTEIVSNYATNFLIPYS